MSLVREPDGNVVLASGGSAWRFFPSFGGGILQAYRDGFPPLLNEGAGAAWQSAVRTGNDPTEASCNGLTPSPIAKLGDPASARFAFYDQETVFDPVACVYERVQFFPDFWLSAESQDDAIAVDPVTPDHGWRTCYQPGRFADTLSTASRPVVFEASYENQSGIFFVGSETAPGPLWSNRLREYPDGRIAFKVGLSLAGAADGAFAGFLMRKTIPQDAATKDDAWQALGVHLFFNKWGNWVAERVGSPAYGPTLHRGQLNAAQAAKLNSIAGLEVEVRGSTAGSFELWLDGVLTAVIVDAESVAGPHFALFATCPSGFIVFNCRQVFDLGLKFTSRYEQWSGGIVSDITVRSVTGQPRAFDRANLPGVFLNTSTFAPGNRRIATVARPDKMLVAITTQPGKHVFDSYGYWAGNLEGTAGVFAVPEIATVDGQNNAQAHVLLDTDANGEFVAMFNPLTQDVMTTAKELRMRIRWATSL